MNSLLFDRQPILPQNLPQIASLFGLAESTLEEVLAQIYDSGQPSWEFYEGAIKDGIEKFFDRVTLDDDDESVPEPDEHEKTVAHAAHSLMAAMADPVNGHFEIENGICRINRANPPALANAYQVVDNVLRLRKLGGKIDDESSWMLGSLVTDLEDYFGEEFNISQVCEQTSKAYNTVWCAGKVFEAFRDKRYPVSYTHHKEVLFKKLEQKSRNLVLHKASLLDLNCKEARELCSIIQALEDDTVVRNLRSKEQAQQLIAAHKETKVKYLVKEHGKWTLFSGSSTTIPVGQEVIDLRNLTCRKDGGAPVAIEKAKRKVIKV